MAMDWWLVEPRQFYPTVDWSLGLLFCSGSDSLRTPSRSEELCRAAQSAAWLSSSSTWQSGGPKSSVDDLCAGRGVVLGRAATILRSIETQPFWLDDLSCQLDKSSVAVDWVKAELLLLSKSSAFFLLPLPQPWIHWLLSTKYLEKFQLSVGHWIHWCQEKTWEKF